MSRKELSEIINSPYSELIKIKIGSLVRATLPQILDQELISGSEVQKMTTENYSKMIFDSNYPVLKKVDENKEIKENRIIGDYTRYYASPVKYKDSRYLITSEWYDRNLDEYIKWLKRKIRLS